MLFKKCTVCLNMFLLFRRSKYILYVNIIKYKHTKNIPNVYIVCYIIVIRVEDAKTKIQIRNKYALRNFRSNTRTRIFYISIYIPSDPLQHNGYRL